MAKDKIPSPIKMLLAGKVLKEWNTLILNMLRFLASSNLQTAKQIFFSSFLMCQVLTYIISEHQSQSHFIRETWAQRTKPSDVRLCPSTNHRELWWSQEELWAAHNCRAPGQPEAALPRWSPHKTESQPPSLPDTWLKARSAYQLSRLTRIKTILEPPGRKTMPPPPHQSVQLKVPAIIYDKEPPSLNLWECHTWN